MSGWLQIPNQIQQILTELKQIQATQQTMQGGLSNVITAINKLSGQIQADQAQTNATLARIVALLMPHDKFRILIGGKAMPIAVVHDADHETVSIQPLLPNGNPDPAGLAAGVVVTWATVTDPSSTPPSFSLTPNPDNQTAILKQLGQDVSGCVISATADLGAGPETEQATFNIVKQADTFVIEFGSETAN
jgi:hypothetical protein